jgi:hypothetical protein
LATDAALASDKLLLFQLLPAALHVPSFIVLYEKGLKEIAGTHSRCAGFSPYCGIHHYDWVEPIDTPLKKQDWDHLL